MYGALDISTSALVAQRTRLNVIASNIANLETPGYRRVDVKFEEMLAKAIKSGRDFNPAEFKPELHRPMETPVKSNGNDVTLEAEVGNMVENSLRHKTYVRLVNKKYAQLNMAIKTP